MSAKGERAGRELDLPFPLDPPGSLLSLFGSGISNDQGPVSLNGSIHELEKENILSTGKVSYIDRGNRTNYLPSPLAMDGENVQSGEGGRPWFPIELVQNRIGPWSQAGTPRSWPQGTGPAAVGTVFGCSPDLVMIIFITAELLGRLPSIRTEAEALSIRDTLREKSCIQASQAIHIGAGFRWAPVQFQSIVFSVTPGKIGSQQMLVIEYRLDRVDNKAESTVSPVTEEGSSSARVDQGKA